MLPKRNIAYKLWISQLLSGRYKTEENTPAYVEVDNLHVVRVNLVGTITHVSNSGNYSFAVLDDSSGIIRLKAWQQDTQLLSQLSLGDIALVVGRVREYNNERYILPSLVKKLDNPNWFLLHQLELLRQYPSQQQVSQQQEYSEHADEAVIKLPSNIRQKILAAIDKIDTPDGVSQQAISSYLNLPEKEIEAAINELIKEGEIYEYKPGRLKLLQ